MGDSNDYMILYRIRNNTSENSSSSWYDTLGRAEKGRKEKVIDLMEIGEVRRKY